MDEGIVGGENSSPWKVGWGLFSSCPKGGGGGGGGGGRKLKVLISSLLVCRQDEIATVISVKLQRNCDLTCLLRSSQTFSSTSCWFIACTSEWGQ